MSKIKDWLMDMEAAAAYTIEQNMPENAAVVFMKSGIDKQYRRVSSDSTLRKVYREVKTHMNSND
jgi:hypothetical protein